MAIVPVLVRWFGIGTVPAIITAFLIWFFPIVVNVATGLATIEPEILDPRIDLLAVRDAQTYEAGQENARSDASVTRTLQAKPKRKFRVEAF